MKRLPGSARKIEPPAAGGATGSTPVEPFDEARRAALAGLLDELKRRSYAFVTPTPATHARVIAREPGREARDLRDVLGWSLPFREAALDPVVIDLLARADVLADAPDGLLRSLVRVSSLGEDLFLHSAYPTEESDAVFFGPDSYRFASLIAAELNARALPPGARLVDVGAGAGIGAIAAARCRPDLAITMTDINPRALALARVNAQVAGVDSRFVLSDGLAALSGDFDVVLANPPYIIDDTGRDYRDGGDMLGGRVAHDMAAEALARLAPGGRLVLYTGTAIVGGTDMLQQALGELAERHRCALDYREIDPDVFGEELVRPAYRGVERIAVAAAVFRAPSPGTAPH